nr:MAG TPA: Baseplate wedge protein [Caudoviricetes sp.]
MSNYPTYLLDCPIAQNGDKTIPPVSGDQAGSGKLSQQLGFPPVTSATLQEGGLPPDRLDMNGVFFLLSQFAIWQQQGGLMNYNASLNYEVGNEILYNGAKYRCMKANGPSGVAVVPGTDESTWKLMDLQAVLFVAQALEQAQKNQALLNIGAAPLNSPAFTGTPTTPTPASSDNSDKICNTAWVRQFVGASQPSAYVVQSSRSGNSWWRKWSDGFIEQHGVCGNSGTFNFATSFTNLSSISLQGTPTSGGHPDDCYCVMNAISTSQFTVSAWRFGNVNWYACGW